MSLSSAHWAATSPHHFRWYLLLSAVTYASPASRRGVLSRRNRFGYTRMSGPRPLPSSRSFVGVGFGVRDCRRLRSASAR